MMRNSKLLLMLTLMIGIIGLSFVGCGDETTVEDNDIADHVIGSIEGIVYENSGACAGGAMGSNVWVYWMSDETRDSVVTDEMGYFLIPEPLDPGNYNLTLKYVDTTGTSTDYAITTYKVHIPNLNEVKADIDDVPTGDYHYRYTTGEDGDDVHLYEKAATVTGGLHAAIEVDTPGAIEKDDQNGQALAPTSPIANVDVLLIYTDATLQFEPLAYSTVTDDEGVYTFTDLPVYDNDVDLVVPAFAYGDSSYAEFDTTITMNGASTVTVPDIYNEVDCNSVPTIVDRNFHSDIPFDYDASLVITFSEPMNTETFVYNLSYGGVVQEEHSWSADGTVLTIDPDTTLRVGLEHTLTITNAESVSGCQLHSDQLEMTFTTMSGISLVSTNVLIAMETSVSDFPTTDPITLTFDMPPVIDPLMGSIVELRDITDGADYPIGIDSSISGNVLTIDPDGDLELDHDYQVNYKVFSSIYRDFTDGTIEFSTEPDSIVPDIVTGFALLDDNVDWDDTHIQLRWNNDPTERADYYVVYAYDNNPINPNTDFIRVGSFNTQDYNEYQENTITLPVQFDRYDDDAIQTPFSDSTHVWFIVRAGNAAGLGPQSDSIMVVDNTPPSSIDFFQLSGSADNTDGTTDSTVVISLEQPLEYMERENNPVWDFVEAGGDPGYVLPEANGHWTWANDSRSDDSAYFIVPAGDCTAGDSLCLTFSDNSGNDTTVCIRIQPYVDITSPTADSTNVEAPSYPVEWTTTDDVPGAEISQFDPLLYYG
ncbi:MAG: hypothetical protein U9N55_06345, partial [candidate division Zixibacteria bacterium]|nr:hypothetical protein [candidate division Zixibacteria bacterium]